MKYIIEYTSELGKLIIPDAINKISFVKNRNLIKNVYCQLHGGLGDILAVSSRILWMAHVFPKNCSYNIIITTGSDSPQNITKVLSELDFHANINFVIEEKDHIDIYNKYGLIIDKKYYYDIVKNCVNSPENLWLPMTVEISNMCFQNVRDYEINYNDIKNINNMPDEIKNKNYILFHPISYERLKLNNNLTDERLIKYQEFCQEIINNFNDKLVIFGAKEDNEFISTLDTKDAINLCGISKIDQFIPIIFNSQGAIGIDSSCCTFASCLRKPTFIYKIDHSYSTPTGIAHILYNTPGTMEVEHIEPWDITAKYIYNYINKIGDINMKALMLLEGGLTDTFYWYLFLKTLKNKFPSIETDIICPVEEPWHNYFSTVLSSLSFCKLIPADFNSRNNIRNDPNITMWQDNYDMYMSESGVLFKDNNPELVEFMNVQKEINGAFSNPHNLKQEWRNEDKTSIEYYERYLNHKIDLDSCKDMLDNINGNNIDYILNSLGVQKGQYITIQQGIDVPDTIDNCAKFWPQNYWNKFIDLLQKEFNVPIIQIGGSSDSILSDNAINTLGRFTIWQTFDLMKNGMFHCGVPGAFVVGAGILNHKCFCLNGMHSEWWKIKSNNMNYIDIDNTICDIKPCDVKGNHPYNMCPKSHHNCMRMIAPELFLDIIKNNINNSNYTNTIVSREYINNFSKLFNDHKDDDVYGTAAYNWGDIFLGLGFFYDEIKCGNIIYYGYDKDIIEFLECQYFINNVIHVIPNDMIEYTTLPNNENFKNFLEEKTGITNIKLTHLSDMNHFAEFLKPLPKYKIPNTYDEWAKDYLSQFDKPVYVVFPYSLASNQWSIHHPWWSSILHRLSQEKDKIFLICGKFNCDNAINNDQSVDPDFIDFINSQDNFINLINKTESNLHVMALSCNATGTISTSSNIAHWSVNQNNNPLVVENLLTGTQGVSIFGGYLRGNAKHIIYGNDGPVETINKLEQYLLSSNKTLDMSQREIFDTSIADIPRTITEKNGCLYRIRGTIGDAILSLSKIKNINSNKNIVIIDGPKTDNNLINIINSCNFINKVIDIRNTTNESKTIIQRNRIDFPADYEFPIDNKEYFDNVMKENNLENFYDLSYIWDTPSGYSHLNDSLQNNEKIDLPKRYCCMQVSTRSHDSIRERDVIGYELIIEFIENDFSLPVILIGGEDDTNFVTYQPHLGKNLVGKTNLFQAMHIIENSQMVIGTYSWVALFAAAMRVPSMFLTVDNPESFWIDLYMALANNVPMKISEIDNKRLYDWISYNAINKGQQSLIKKEDYDTKYLLNNMIQEKDIDEDYIKSNDYYQWYYSYGKTFKPNRVLEFGVRYGYSIASIIQGSIDAGDDLDYVCLVDNEQYSPGSNEIAYSNLIKRFYDHYPIIIEIINSNTLDPDLYNKINLDEKYDMIHLDASHREDTIKKELDIAWDILADGGVIIIDDIIWDKLYDAVLDWTYEKQKGDRTAISFIPIENIRGHIILQKGFKFYDI